jgi:diamine N-acetyltransferase
MTEIVCRPFQEQDAPAVLAVALEAWRYTYRAIFTPEFIEDFVHRNYAPEATVALLPQIESGSMFFHVAEHESKIVGYCHFGVADRQASLLRIYLLPAYIGQGLGRRLLQLGGAFVASHGLSTYFCFVHGENEIGKAFYLRNGFRHIPERDDEGEWYMEKGLY